MTVLSPAHPARPEGTRPEPQPACEPRADEREREAPRFAELLASSGERRALGGGPLVIAVSARARTLCLELDGPALSQHAARALAAVLRDAVRRRERTVELRLRPAELGGLTIRIALEGSYLVHLEASASDPRVAERLLEGRRELERALARWGLVLGRLAIRTGETQAETPVVAEAGQEPGSEAEDRTRRSFFEVVI